jgi:O-antigen ligase
LSAFVSVLAMPDSGQYRVTMGDNGATGRSRSFAYILTAPDGDALTVARVLSIVAVLLIVSSTFKFRHRSADLALQGNADSEVLLELAVFGATGAWLCIRRLLNEWVAATPRRTLPARSALRIMRLFAFAALITSAWSPTSIAPVRAVQYVIAVEFFAEVVYVCAGNLDLTEVFWKTLSAALLIATGLAVFLTFAPGTGFTPWLATFQGVKRLRFVSMHPIATAQLLGLLSVVAWEPLLQDRILGRRARFVAPAHRAAQWALAITVTGALILTHERSGTIAGLAAVGVLILSTRDRGRKQLVAVLAVISVALTLVVFGHEIQKLLLRGQTASQVTSGSGRNLILPIAWKFFLARPFFGWGYLSGRSVFLPIVSWAGESHNTIIEIGVSFGIFGLALFAIVFWRWWMLSRSGRLSGRDEQRLLGVRSTALVVLVVIIGFGSEGFGGPPALPVLALLLGLAFAELAAMPDARALGKTQGPHDALASSGMPRQLEND